MQDPFLERVVIAAISPLVTAFVGTLGVGLIAAKIAARIQRRQQDRDMRHEIIVQMTETASSIYLETQRYWRATERETTTAERLAMLRERLDERYHAARVAGEALETRLRIYFATDKPWKEWHATMDLLTVRYFQLIGLDTEALLGANAGPEHSGLSVDQLRQRDLVLETYHQRLSKATNAVLRGKSAEFGTAG